MTVATTDYVMPEGDARRLTEKIRITAHTYAEAREKLIGYVEQAKQGNAHLALGYRSWTEYLAEVLGEEPMRLARDERREVVQLLSNEGMSTRAIAPIVGASFKTVARDMDAPVSNDTPASAPSAPSAESAADPEIDLSRVDKATGEIYDGQPEVTKLTGANSVSHPGPFNGDQVLAENIAKAKKVTGRDGKTYERSAPKPGPKRQKPITDQARDAGNNLRKNIERIQKITNDPRFARNKEQVAAHLRGHLLYAVEVCQDLIDQFTQEGA